MICTVSNPKRMGCYHQQTNLKTIDTIKNALDADTIVNFQLFDLKTMKDALCLKLNGQVLANDGADYWGYAWNNGDTRFTLTRRLGLTNETPGMDRFDNFAGAVLVAKDGKAITNPQFGASLFPGYRGRTCIGRKANGDILIYCYPDGSSGASYIHTLGQKMVDLGCVDAINYDGGASCQILCPNGSVRSSRKVATFLWFQMDKQSITTKNRCPHKEPTGNICYGSRGEGAKWTQWMLNAVTGSSLIVDGIFGAKSYVTLLAFQRTCGLVADGISGAKTRDALKVKYQEL